uniref:Aminopeptidase like 1 n=1 Tax=Salmo trutta TaxID=8032 RepID=A0A674CU41_SALTR
VANVLNYSHGRPINRHGQLNNLQQATWTQVKGKLQPAVSVKIWQAALSALNPNPTDSCALYLSHADLAALPSRVSRHNSTSSAHFLSRLVRTCLPGGTSRCILMVCERSDMFACAIVRAFPIFSRRSASSRRAEKTQLNVEFITVGQENRPLNLTVLQCLANAADGVRLAARIEIKAVGTELGVTPVIIREEELKQKVFGGTIYGVGKAAVNPPALAVLSHKPDGATQTIAWVGKGIVYDTGGLSIKGKVKRDCGGAAAILEAFKATVNQGFKDNLRAVFCLAENAVGPTATRPDDIHTLYSGKTVEINNTDAEGRLVLSDGVVYASKDLSADIILDMATLTGAQGISTGKYHCAVMTNSEQWETACVRAGRSSGDLACPLVYCPELHFNEFTSAVADMKNSVAGRKNATSSCAGLFIGSHLGFDWPGVWVHVDIAFPVHAGEHTTGFGVALFGQASDDPMLNQVSPLGAATMKAASRDPVERNCKRRRLV